MSNVQWANVKFFPQPTGELYGWRLATLVFQSMLSHVAEWTTYRMTDSRSKGLWFNSWGCVEVCGVFSVTNAESDKTCDSLHITVAGEFTCSGSLCVESRVFLFQPVPVWPLELSIYGMKSVD